MHYEGVGLLTLPVTAHTALVVLFYDASKIKYLPAHKQGLIYLTSSQKPQR